MNEYRAQRLKEDLTFAQQRNKRQRQQLANYKKVHEKDLKEIEKLNNIINELSKENEQLKANWDKLKEYIRKNIIYDDVGMKILDPSLLEDYMQELKGSDKE